MSTADGSGAVTLAPDGKTLLGRVQNDAVELAHSPRWWTRSDRTLRTLPHVRTDAGGTVTGARFSPDRRWIAFTAGVQVGSTRVVVVRNVAAEIGSGPK